MASTDVARKSQPSVGLPAPPPTPEAPQDAPIGVLLMTFGTAESVEDVPGFLARVRGGGPVPAEIVAEFQRRFALIGGSPLVEITRQQAAALEESLNRTPDADQRPDRASPISRSRPASPKRGGEIGSYRVGIGMRFAAPGISDGLLDLVRSGARRIIGIILSPQYSPVVLGGYLGDLHEAQKALPRGAAVRVAGAWHAEPAFIEALACRLQEALEGDGLGGSVPTVLFTAHSLPRRVAERDPAYLAQLEATAAAVAGKVGLAPDQRRFAYQSAGHTGDEWLGPDVRDLLPGLRSVGCTRVLIAPVQFVADHLEVLYDIDVAAREEASSLGVELRRIESLNTMPRFIDALACVVRRELASWSESEQKQVVRRGGRQGL